MRSSMPRVELADRLSALDAEMYPVPWPKDWLYEVVRHGDRNMDIESYEMPEWTGPNRYDGAPLVTLRNALPEIVALVRAAEEIDFVFAKGPIETTCHRNDFRGLTEALDALRVKFDAT